MKMVECRRKNPSFVEAYRIPLSTDDVDGELVDFIEDNEFEAGAFGGIVIPEGHNDNCFERQDLNPGDWIVIYEDGSLSGFTDEAFHRTFEVI